MPPPRASTRRAPAGPESSAALLSVSASSAVGASAVTASRPVQAGSPVAGIEQVVRAAAGRGAPCAAHDARGRDGAVGDPPAAPPAPARAGARLRPRARRRRGRPRPRRRPTTARQPSSRATRSAAWPLPEPPRSSRSPGGRSIVPQPSSTSHLAPASRRIGRARRGRGPDAGASGPAGALAPRTSGGSRRPRARRAGTDRPARRCGAPPRARRARRRAAVGDAGTAARGSAFRAHSSDPGRKREAQASKSRSCARARASSTARRPAR